MARPYRSSSRSSGSKGASFSYPNHHRYPDLSASAAWIENGRSFAARTLRALLRFWRDRGRRIAYAAVRSAAHRLRLNLAYDRLFAFPHLLVAIWFFMLLWGERWAFHSKVQRCRWSAWEKWPEGAQPHRVALVADPQLIDPHTYLGRPWPLDSLTMLLTDNFLRRSYGQLQTHLDPDSIFFLGDLFDGGREWKTAHGDFEDPSWAPRPKNQQKYWKQWLRSYGEEYWLEEYARFGDIFINPWLDKKAGRRRRGGRGGKGQLVVTLPGNHDLGFGDNIKVAVRNRFETYFGSGNRVDVIGNHTFVSVDTVSMSAASSPEAKRHDLKAIYEPVYEFLDKLPAEKQKAVARELRRLHGHEIEARHPHGVEELPGKAAGGGSGGNGGHRKRDEDDETSSAPADVPELPTVLLTHVPLYRPPGTPCGPLREKWPPTKPPKGQTEPVFPDHRNAISVSGGYQYQNVLGEKDSEELVRKVGNVVHAFSGDDHDYCAVTHPESRGNVPEITVKSISMAMGVSRPGFLLVSLYNPIDPATGKPLPPSLGGVPPGQPTLQTHLCLLPSQLSTYLRYVGFAVACVAALALRAVLVPAFGLTPFALDPAAAQASSFRHYYHAYAASSHASRRGRGNSRAAILPLYKVKQEDYDEYALPPSGLLSPKGTVTAAAVPGHHHKPPASASLSSSLPGHGRRKSKSGGSGGGKWGWGGRSRAAPRIEIPSEGEEDDFGSGYYHGGKWKARGRGWGRAGPGQRKVVAKLVAQETWAGVWRVMWMVLGFFAWLNWRG
ncbi:hypothetical protein VTJ83DRAFT_2386 [Remersonia thermophila]|uniref:Calcineurin-like phosphoesterase domain-containing protein n=1 Tax=Remersonia thermophila TaxID=72144 RepID=A0ABR4DIN5_9PEZI